MTKQKNKEEAEIKSPVITAAAINDGFCNYSYEIKKGIGSGAVHSVKDTKHLIDADMEISFFALSVHLAIMDDIFFHSGEEINSIKEIRKSPHTKRYNVTGFKIKTQGEKEFVILTGTKQIECSNYFMSIESPKIPLDDLSSYTWHKELKEAVDAAREEVELYSNGKYTEVEHVEKENPDQLTIASPEAQANFEAGRV